MTSEQIQMMVAMILYISVVIGIGVFFAKRANQNSENYFLGGRSLGPWVTAMSAEASDMSGWLLMGLPGVAYWLGYSEAFWTALGLALGTYLNWLLVAKRLRRYSVVAGNSITIPEFFSNRFREKKKVILLIAALFIFIFFTVYAASCFVTTGKLFNTLFGFDYKIVMIAGAVFVLAYTFIGGFLAESVSDFMQGVVMIIALVSVLGVAIYAGGGISQIMKNLETFPGFLEFFNSATPTLNAAEEQIIQNGQPLFDAPTEFGIIKIISTMAWGLGYFGVPQVLLRFMAIKNPKDLTLSRRIAMIWVVISLTVAVFIGVFGRAVFPTEFITYTASENIFIKLSSSFLPAILAGIVMSGILAATISSSDSYLLIAASAFAKNIFQGILKKNATDKQVLWVTRIILLIITALGIVIALDENSVIFVLVAFAWAGFGATFGPLMLFSLFWKRTTAKGAFAGMVGGAAAVFAWKFLVRPLGGIWNIYELLPAFIFSSLLIVVVSLLDKPPSGEIQQDFEKAALVTE